MQRSESIGKLAQALAKAQGEMENASKNSQNPHFRSKYADLAEIIKKPPLSLTTEQLWMAYEQLEKSRVRKAGPQKLLTNIISLIRFAIGRADVLEPYTETIERRFRAWLAGQEKAGRTFTPDQKEWLNMIKDRIATSLTVEMDDFELPPFQGKGGTFKVYQLFGKELNSILDELNEVTGIGEAIIEVIKDLVTLGP